MENFAGAAEMTLFWHCVFPGDISSKPRRLEIYAYTDCGEDNDGFHSVVLWLRHPEYPIPLYVQYVTPMLTTSPFLRVSLCSLSLPGTMMACCAKVCQPGSMYRQPSTTNTGVQFIYVKNTQQQRQTDTGTCEKSDHEMILKLLLHLVWLWNSFELICTCRSSFLIRCDCVTSNSGRWIVPSAV